MSPDPSTPPPAETAAPELRPVTSGEVMRFAKPRCKTCCGRGMFMVSRAQTRTTRLELCGCAESRFLKSNRAALTHNPDTGEWFWNP